MTAPASVYPRSVDELMPAARRVPRRAGELVPSKRRLMTALKVGADKAGEIRGRLLTEAQQHTDAEAHRTWPPPIESTAANDTPTTTDADDQPATVSDRPGQARPDTDDTATGAGSTASPLAPAGEPDAKVSAQVRVDAETDDTGTHAPTRPPAVWPIVLLALPAFVAIWSGWVGLGGLTGFGVVHPLPGIADGFSLNTAITLPIGVETYGAYALYVWLSGRVPGRARRFAKWSALGSLTIGALGQVAYHLLVAAGVSTAPWWITTAVACLPVAVLGMGAALAHLTNSHNQPV